jgi:hypothetical protein
MSDIYTSSRYYNQTVDYISLEEGGDVRPIVFYQFDDLHDKNYGIYTFAQGDRLDRLSFQFFNRPDMWWAIAEYNPEIQDIFNIKPGTLLRIPNV